MAKARIPTATATVTPRVIVTRFQPYPFSFSGVLTVSTSPAAVMRYDTTIEAVTLYLKTSPATGSVTVQIQGFNPATPASPFVFATINLGAGQHFTHVPLNLTLGGYDKNQANADKFQVAITATDGVAADLYGELDISNLA
jgi:hypothetical protein